MKYRGTSDQLAKLSPENLDEDYDLRFLLMKKKD